VDLSCVILSFNSSRSIRKCLESLVDAIAVNQLKAEILIVDNGSTDRSLEIISEISAKQTASPNLPDSQNLPDIKLHRLEKNYGTTASRNIALRQSTGKKILILDSDAYVSPEALRGLIDYLDQHPKVGLVAPKLIFPDGRPQLSTDQFPTVSRKIERVDRFRPPDPRSLRCCRIARRSDLLCPRRCRLLLANLESRVSYRLRTKVRCRARRPRTLTKTPPEPIHLASYQRLGILLRQTSLHVER